MRRDAVWAIARKDLRTIRSNSQVWLPMALVPLLLGVLLPVGLVAALAHTGGGALGPKLQEMEQWVGKLPLPALEALPSVQAKIAFALANYLLAPLFLLIPLLSASVVSADSFAGEKERGTLESLLFSPVDLQSLFAGKLLAALLPSLALSLGTFLLDAVLLNLVGWPLFHGVFFPQWNWLPLLALVLPMVSLGAVLVSVVVSARVDSFQAAYQLGGVVVVPALLLVGGQASGLLLLSTWVVAAVGLVLALGNALLLKLLVGRMDRAALFETQIR